MSSTGRDLTRARRGPVAITVGVLGELLLTAGVLVLLYVAYVLWGTGIQTDRAQGELREQATQAWSGQQGAAGGVDAGSDDAAAADAEPAGVPEGEAYAVLRIPRLGADWEWVVVQGTDLSDLARGPGHYLHSADPGELGNLAIAGHRSGHGEPFAHLDSLRAGDTIEVETADGEWTYTVDQEPTVIMPTDVWVIDPVPGADADAEPAERRITLTTCHPRYGSTQRMYVSGVLTAGEEV